MLIEKDEILLEYSKKSQERGECAIAIAERQSCSYKSGIGNRQPDVRGDGRSLLRLVNTARDRALAQSPQLHPPRSCGL